MCPLSRPVSRHCAENSAWDFLPITPTTTPATGSAIRAMSASCQDSQNIMPTMPITVSAEYTSEANACWRACWTLSTSLVARESRSPRCPRSKWLSGSRLILASMSSRRRNTRRITRSLSTRPCSHMNSWATRYMASTIRISRPSSVKSIPSPGVNAMPESISAAWSSPWARSPSMTCSRLSPPGICAETTPPKITSIARPRTCGAHTLSTTATSTISATTTRPSFSVRNRLMSRFADGQNALALRAGPPPQSSVAPCSWISRISSSVRCSLMPRPPRSAGSPRSPGRSGCPPAARRGCRGRPRGPRPAR